MTPEDRPIGVFDSGLGGLTVARALLDLLPGEHVVYFGDTGRFPYGPKPAEDVLKYSLEIVDVLLDRAVKMIVIACNSASAAALDQLRDRLDVPVVGVIEPGLRAAARVTRSGRIGVIGTVGTIASGAYQRAGARIDAELELTCAACPGFVEFVEQGDVDSDQVHVLAERLLAPVREAAVDTLVLGCTHYPLLARTIADVMGPDVVLVSSADETAFEVRATLGASEDHCADAASEGVAVASSPESRASTSRVSRRLARATEKRSVNFITSGDVEMFRMLGAQFLGPEVERVEAWSWS